MSGGTSYSHAEFTMEGGTISGNNAQSGGGLIVTSVVTSSSQAEVTMKGGTISGNSAAVSGGGVCIEKATFKKEPGAVIYGSNEGGNSNVAGGQGHAVYVDCSPVKKRDTSVGAAETLSAVYDHGTASWNLGGTWE
jgi:hypothetical protein